MSRIAQVIALKEVGHKSKEINKLVGVAQSRMRQWCACYCSKYSGEMPVSSKGCPQKAFVQAVNLVNHSHSLEFTECLTNFSALIEVFQ